MAEQYANGGQSTLSAGISSTATSLTVVSAAGFSAGPTFRLQLQSATVSNTNIEIVEVTAVSGTTFTVTRAAEAYNGVQTAYSWNAGDFVTQVLTAGGLAASAPTIPSYDTTVLTKLSLAPVAYWKLNDPVGSSTAADRSGNGYTLTVNGTVTFGEPSVVPSDSETSAQGDGSTGYLSTSFPASPFPTGKSPFTLIVAANIPVSQPTSGQANIVTWGSGANAATFELNSGGWAGAHPITTDALGSGQGSYGPGLAVGAPHVFGVSWDGLYASAIMDGQVGMFGSAAVKGAVPAAVTQPCTFAGGSFYALCGMTGGTTTPASFSNFPVGRIAMFAGILTPKDWALLMQAFTGV